MKDVSAFAIFCEDIRRELGGRSTIIGIYPDSIDVPSFPGALRRLAVFFRVRFSVDGNFDEPISVDLEIDGGMVEHVSPQPVRQDMVKQAVEKARQRGLPYTSITARVQIEEPVAVPGPCVIRAVLKKGDETELCGLLNIRATPASEVSATASAPPSEQSPPSASES